MLPQHQMIERVRALCHSDARLDAAMMYGSFTRGEGDAFSDIEFLLFFDDEGFASVDPRAWLSQIAPVEMLYANEFGITVVIFGNLIRGEFHFHRLAELEGVAAPWPGVITFPSLDATLIAEKSGRLARLLEPIIGPPLEQATPPKVQFTVYGYLNWLLFGISVLRRGEYARAHEILNIVHRHLLWMARALEGTTDNWLTPSKSLERDLSPEAYARLRGCTAPLDPDALRGAYAACWRWGGELAGALRDRYAIDYPAALWERIGGALEQD